MEKTASVRAVVFDAYGTLFDVYSVGLLAEQLFPGRGEALAVLWRDKQLEYTRICSMSGRQPPHSLPARHARSTSVRVSAPSRTAARMSRSVSPLQWQTIILALHASPPRATRRKLAQ